MIQWTDRHYRFMMRLITKRTLLWTEMTMSNALYYNPDNLGQFLSHDASEYPLALQLGGSDPEMTSEAAYLANAYGQGRYAQINLNCGCPSNRAKKAGFGAELMLEPEKTRRLVSALVRKVPGTPITVKCRIGVSPERESFDELVEFLEACRAGGARHFIIHARTVVLRGLTPAQNRSIPPLQYDCVYALCRRFPELDFVINGGIKSFEQADALLSPANPPEQYPVSNLVGAMIGREAYKNPWLLLEADSKYYGETAKAGPETRRDVLDAFLDYCNELQGGGPDFNSRHASVWGINTCNLIKPLHNFFSGCPSEGGGEGAYKQHLNEALLKDKNRSVQEVVLGILARHDAEALGAFLDAPLKDR